MSLGSQLRDVTAAVVAARWWSRSFIPSLATLRASSYATIVSRAHGKTSGPLITSTDELSMDHPPMSSRSLFLLWGVPAASAAWTPSSSAPPLSPTPESAVEADSSRLTTNTVLSPESCPGDGMLSSSARRSMDR